MTNNQQFQTKPESMKVKNNKRKMSKYDWKTITIWEIIVGMVLICMTGYYVDISRSTPRRADTTHELYHFSNDCDPIEIDESNEDQAVELEGIYACMGVKMCVDEGFFEHVIKNSPELMKMISEFPR